MGRLKFIYEHKFTVLMFILILGLFMVTVSHVYINPMYHRYEIKFTASEVTTSKFKLEEENGLYTISGLKSELQNKSNADKVLKEELAKVTNNYEIVKETSLNKIVKIPLTFSFIIGGLIGLITSIILLIISKIKDKKEDLDFYTNGIFKYPFSREYNKLAINSLKGTKNIAVMSVIIALIIVCKAIPIPSGFANLGLGLTYLVLATACMIYGPFVAILIGFISDNLGFFLFPNGSSYNILYVFNACLSCFIYGVFLYRTKITFSKVLLARIFVNLFVNAVLGSIWWGLLMKWDMAQIRVYMLFTSLPKNVAYLLPQAILLFIVLKLLMPALTRERLIDKRVKDNITFI